MKIFLAVFGMVIAVVSSKNNKTLKGFALGYTQFTADIYKEILKSQPSNFLVCPLSIEVMLAAIHEGAAGETAHQLTEALYLPQDNASIRKIFHELSQTLKSTDNYNLSSVNEIYIKNSFKINNQFKKTASGVYNTEIRNINFKQSDQTPSKAIRSVKENTHKEIEDLISKNNLSADAQAILINTMYFHGLWLTAFNTDKTNKRAFNINANNQVELDMMEITGHFLFAERPDINAKALTLPYEGEDLSLNIILPNGAEGLSDLEEQIDETLADSDEISWEVVHIVLPKFKIESTVQFKPVLQNLGITDAFQNSANFSGIGVHQEPLVVSDVIQKAFIEVDEQGTRTAATAGIIYTSRPGPNPPPPREFIADHPFVFYLKSSAGVLLVGRFVRG